MAGVTRNLRLRLADDLTADARYNLERIDQLGTVFPIGDTASQTINSSADIRLNANATVLGGDGNGLVFAPNLQLSSTLKLESGPYTFDLRTATQSSNISFTLPPDTGTAGQFLQTDGASALTWSDPPTSNFDTLNDTSFTNLQAGQIAQYDGANWVNTNISETRQTGVFDWLTTDGNSKVIVHGWDTTKIQVWVYEPGSKSQIFINAVDYLDNDTILLTANIPPETDYEVHLIQTV